MNTKQQKRFETVEDLISFVMGNTYRASGRWTLDDYSDWVWANEEAGAAWDEEHFKNGWYVDLDDPRRAEWEAADTELCSRRPEQYRKTSYTLVECGHGYSNTRYTLSDELGAAIDGIWTKKRSTYGSGMIRVASMTIPGMLKRLGKSDIGKQVKAAQAEADARAAKNKRNYVRSEARRLAGLLVDLMEKNLDTVQFSCDVFELTHLQDED